MNVRQKVGSTTIEGLLENSVAPTIEDPFSRSMSMNNLGACMNGVSLSRLHEELDRANDICSRQLSLSELLTPYAPPEGRDNGGDAAEQEEDLVKQENPETGKAIKGKVVKPETEKAD